MNRILYRISGIFIALGVLAFLGYQLYRHIIPPYRTEVAYVYVQSDYIAVDGVAVRDETVLKTQNHGVISYLYDDGAKVSKSLPVAEIYQTDQDAANQSAITKLEKEIALLSEAADPGRSDYINAEVLSGQISDRLSQLSYIIQSRNLSGLDVVGTDYLMLLNTRQIATMRATDFDARLSQLKAEAQSLKSATHPALATVVAAVPGYFVGITDGYEETLTASGADSLTPSAVQQIVLSKPGAVSQQDTVGKIISGFEWYYTALVPNSELARFYTGLTVSVTFPYISDTAYTAIVTAITPEEGNEYTAVALRLSNMNGQVCAMRAQKAEISFASYRGLKIRTDALRFVEGDPGVYVMNAAGVRFKKIDILFYGDGFVLSKQRTEDGYLRQYDEMILAGKELVNDG